MSQGWDQVVQANWRNSDMLRVFQGQSAICEVKMKVANEVSGTSIKRRGAARGLLRVAAAVPLAFGLLALLAPAAWAHVGTATITCTKVTYSFSDFPNKPLNTVHENVFEDGLRIASQTYTFDGPTGGNTISIDVVGTQSMKASAHWNTNGVSGSFRVATELTGCGGIG
jgi:hypothetical protein